MSVSLQTILWGSCAILIGICSGCRSSDVEDAALASSAGAVIVPVASVAVAAYGSDVVVQNSSIAVGAPKQWYSEELTNAELWQKGMQHGYKFHEPWKYMGTKDGEHYLMLYPFLGFREIYRIDVSEYIIEEPFELTSRSSKWREITVFTHHSGTYPLQIEPQLFEQPEGLVPIQVYGVPAAAEFGGGVEDLFMQEVSILEEE